MKNNEDFFKLMLIFGFTVSGFLLLLAVYFATKLI